MLRCAASLPCYIVFDPVTSLNVRHGQATEKLKYHIAIFSRVNHCLAACPVNCEAYFTRVRGEHHYVV
jgi:hypothetical protein